jgi:hypothetical protein
VLRIDAHFIDTVSRKEHAGRLRGRYGHHPMAVICDNTGECLADQLRPGTAGANNAADHIALLSRTINQIPARWRRNLLITADGAGATHDLLNLITALNRPVDDTDPANGAHRGDTRRSPHTQTPKPHPLNNQPSTPINATKIVKRRGIRTRVEPDGTYLIDSLVGPTEGDERGPTASDILTGGCELESGGSRRMHVRRSLHPPVDCGNQRRLSCPGGVVTSGYLRRW